MRRKKRQGHEEPTEAGERLAPGDVQQVEFRLAFRGYNERDVDGFLDRVTEELSSYIEENRRLREGAGLPPAPGAASEEAEQIVARAREEADAIVRRAEQQAAVILATGTGAEGTRAAVAPFLNAEREFLQSLGTLVQTHAEDIRRMVFAFRAKAEGERPAPTSEAVIAIATSSPPSEDVVVLEPSSTMHERASQLEPATAAEIRDRMAAAEVSSAPPTAPAVREPIDVGATGPDVTGTGSGAADTSEERGPKQGAPHERASEDAGTEDAGTEEGGTEDAGPVVVESATEPVFSGEGTPPGERRERSLRELFWGED